VARPNKQSLPKYMNLKANTQYELAQTIDAALANAEAEDACSAEQACWGLWQTQILDYLFEGFHFEPEQVRAPTGLDTLETEASRWVVACAELYRVQHGDAAAQAAFGPLMRMQLEQAFLMAIDMIHGKGLWRFDIQRSMQDYQGRLLRVIQSLSV